MKIWQLSHVIVSSTSQFYIKQILHQSSVPSNITRLYFLNSNIIYFAQKQPIKGQIFEIFECSGQNLLNSSCQFWTDKSILLQILHLSPVSWKINPLYFFGSIIIYFGQKQPFKGPIFEIFECSGQNLLNSSCQFQSGKSIPLQILHHYPVSWEITHLEFFNSNIIYFGQKQPIKVEFFETFQCSSQSSSNFLCQFWNNKSIPLQIFHHSSVSLHMSSSKSETLHFDGLFLLKLYKVSAKRFRRVISNDAEK